jgi:hypothetical protein
MGGAFFYSLSSGPSITLQQIINLSVGKGDNPLKKAHVVVLTAVLFGTVKRKWE